MVVAGVIVNKLKNVVMIMLIDEIIEILGQTKYDQRLYLDDQVKKLTSMKQDIEREDLNWSITTPTRGVACS